MTKLSEELLEALNCAIDYFFLQLDKREYDYIKRLGIPMSAEKLEDSALAELKTRLEEEREIVHATPGIKNVDRIVHATPGFENTKTEDPVIISSSKLIVKEVTELDKSYKLKREDGRIAFVGKTLVQDFDATSITVKTNSEWVLNKINWLEETKNGKTTGS